VTPPRMTVLFVDDEPALLQTIVRALRSSTLEVLAADGAEQALATMRGHGVDVLVSDIDMPGMSGLDLVKIVRREFPATLRMLFTGTATMDRAIEAINEGEVHRFFTKPFDLQLFRATFAATAERIGELRRDEEHRTRDARRGELFRWIESAFPGTLDVMRNARGEVLLGLPIDDLPLRGDPRSRK
jgi:DNA-binding NtrC family response regulator